MLPGAILVSLLGAWALVLWGRDESLPSVVANQLPALVYIGVALGALGACVVARSWWAGLAALASMLLAVAPLGGWNWPSETAPAVADYRALTWNVEQWSSGGERVARAVAELSPDVFCLQEARNYDGEVDHEWPAFEAALPGYRLIRFGEMAFGTRWPILEERRLPLHDELWKRPLLDITLRAPNGARLRVLDAHLAYTKFYGSAPGALVRSGQERRAQAERILAHVGSSSEPMLLCGDLNAPPNSAALSVLRQRFGDAWRLRGTGFGMTTSALHPIRRIDYLLVSGLQVGDIRVIEEPLSDHLALTATFALPASTRAER